MKSKKILVVCNWPLGGIRTYLKYLYASPLFSNFDIVFLLSKTQEKDAILDDFKNSKIIIKWCPRLFGMPMLWLGVLFEAIRNRPDIIHSQGFLSATHAAPAKSIFSARHLLTIHGVLESHYFQGKWAKIKALVFKRAMLSVDVFHGVSYDILEDVRVQIPYIEETNKSLVVIPNGIDTQYFTTTQPEAKPKLRAQLGVPDDAIVFGFFGRYMPQKGFDVLIRACKSLMEDGKNPTFQVIAVGSGDFEREYQQEIKTQNLQKVFTFIPFTPDIRSLVQGCNAVVMPSNWEAYGLLAAEVLCLGIPLIATNCIGLRETIEDTPTLVATPNDDTHLSEKMKEVLFDNKLPLTFENFIPEAAERFSIKNAQNKMHGLLCKM